MSYVQGMRNILVIGGSRGIGLSVAEHFRKTDKVWSVSRSESPFGTWIEADIAKNADIAKITAYFEIKALDALLIMGGTWEPDAFTSRYRFLGHDLDEIDRVLSVNCAGPIKLVHALHSALSRSENPRVIAMGSLSTKDGGVTREVANTASKFGLRGAFRALEAELPEIGFTLINPGNVATPEVLDDIGSGDFVDQVPIALSDLISVVESALNLTPSSRLSEVDVVQARKP